MRKLIPGTARGLAFLFIIFIFGSYIIVAQNPVTGEWKGRVDRDKPGKIHLSFSRDSERSGRNQFGSSIEITELQGLTPDQTGNGQVSFQLVRDAGTVECVGTFVDGKGSGTYRFTPNQAFISAMQSRGFDFTKPSSKDDRFPEARLLSAAMLNVTVALADDLRSSNFDNLEVDDLFKAAIFKIDGRLMADMKATGFPNLTMEDLVKARIFKIDADFVRDIKDMGFGVTDFENLVKYRIFKVTPEYLGSLRTEGLTELGPEDVVQLRIFNIDAAYVREARSSDPNITVDKIVKKKIGVWGKN